MDGENDPSPAPVDPVERWVADGLRDVEIAVRLGVSVGEARERRSRVHGEPLRSELALPPPLPLTPSPPALGIEEEDPPARNWLTLIPALVVAALAIAGGWWLLSAGSEPAPIRSVEPFVPAPIPGNEKATALQRGPSIPFPNDLSLVLRVSDGSGGARALERVYRDAGGVLRREELLTAPEGTSIGRVVSDVDGWLLVAAINDPEATSFLQSLDGGVSWESQGSLAGAWEPVGVWEGETIAWRERGGGLGEFVIVPSGEPFVPPYPDGSLPLAILSRGKLLWRVPGSGVIAEGDRAPYSSPNIDQGSYHEWLAPQPTGTGTMIHWRGASPVTGEDEDYVGIMTRRGRITQSWVGIPGPVAGRRDGATLVSLAATPDANGDLMAVLVELQANQWRPIVADADLLVSNDQRFIASVRQGPFVRVRAGDECTPIRALSEIDADVIACAAGNVILRAPGETRIHVDYTWMQVIAPGGRSGWIKVDDLE
ncbi:MAG: hypothetical protein WD557_05695 [Dehalococcoidia bacterium]